MTLNFSMNKQVQAAQRLRNNCGTGAGGFQPGNKCAAGDGGSAKEKSMREKKAVKESGASLPKTTKQSEDRMAKAIKALVKSKGKGFPFVGNADREARFKAIDNVRRKFRLLYNAKDCGEKCQCENCKMQNECGSPHKKKAMENQRRLHGQGVLVNRDFKLPSDNWYHIAPVGEFEHKPSKLMQVLDRGALESMVNRFRQEKADPNFPGILVDYDHFSLDTDKPSEAAGWVLDLQNRDDGLYAQIHWTDKGREAVEGGRYRLVSPVWKMEDVDKLDNGRVRPMRLDSVALTNDPNLKGLKPLTVSTN